MFKKEAQPPVRSSRPLPHPSARRGLQPRDPKSNRGYPTLQRGYFSALTFPSEPENSPAAGTADFPPAGVGKGEINMGEAEGRSPAAGAPQPGPAHQLRQLHGSRRDGGRHRLRLQPRFRPWPRPRLCPRPRFQSRPRPSARLRGAGSERTAPPAALRRESLITGPVFAEKIVIPGGSN